MTKQEYYTLEEVNVEKLVGKGITMVTHTFWYVRIWYVISNPFRYLFTGKLKY